MMLRTLENLPDWPQSMNRATALMFTGVSNKVLSEYEVLGIVSFKAIGPKGSKVALKTDLQRMLNFIFEHGEEITPPSEDMNFA